MSRSNLLQSIQQLFEKHPTQEFNPKQLLSQLKLSGASAQKTVEKALETLVFQEVLMETSRGRYKLRFEEQLYEGRIDISANGRGFIIVEGLAQDLIVEEKDLNRALNGDTVLARAYKTRRDGRQQAEVLEIKHRAKTRFVGQFRSNKKLSWVIPDDHRVNVDFVIQRQDTLNAKTGEKVVIEMTDWDEYAENPNAKVVKILGPAGNNDAEITGIGEDYGFSPDFPKNVEAEAAAFPEKIPAAEIKKRLDCREVLTFTIDPFDAKDFDDAISFRILENGHYEVGVHIADVSYYVRPGTALDEEAFRRATSVYLVDRTFPMLPEKLSNGLCSLRPNEDKLCFSAIFEMDAQAKIHKEWIGRSIIHSDRRFTYEEVQEILDSRYGELAEELLTLNHLAHQLREARFKKGAFSFETEEVKFRLDANGKPVEVIKKVRKDAHKLIEDFMLLANRRVTEWVDNIKKEKKKAELPFVYRVHESPSDDKIRDFALMARRLGYKLDLSSARGMNKSMNQLLQDIEGKPEQNILSTLAIRSMMKAYYSTQNKGHYGLAFEHYTHFTSPIRRYPDLMVHRLLAEYIEKGEAKPDKQLESRCKHSSVQEASAAEAERTSIKLKQVEYMAGFIGKIFEGVISGITEWGIYVEIIENKCEGMVRLASMKDDFYAFDEHNYRVIGKRSDRKYTLGDLVKVKVLNADIEKKQIDFSFVKQTS